MKGKSEVSATGCWDRYLIIRVKSLCWKNLSQLTLYSFKICSYFFYLIFTMIAAYIMYMQVYYFVMPEILQYSEPILYSEKTHKECSVQLGDSIFIEDTKYNLHVFLQIPETQDNQNIPAVNLELWEEDKLLGKAYKSLKKHQNFSGSIKRWVSEIGVIFGFYEDVQEVKLSIPAELSPDAQTIKFKIYPEELSIQQVKVQFEVKLKGFRYYLHEHFTLACVIGCFWIMILQILLVSQVKQKIQ